MSGWLSRGAGGPRHRGLLLAILACGASSCAEATFSTHARDNHAEDLRRAIAASRELVVGPQNATGRPMAFMVTAAPDERLVGFDLGSNRVLWSEKADVRSRVVVGRSFVAHRQGERDLVGRDPASGRIVLRVQLGEKERFVGMAADEERLYYVVQTTAAGRRTSHAVAVDGTGKVLWRVPAGGSLGAPAARGGVVAVPYAYQNVSFLDGRSGRELARVRATDEQITFVRALPEGFFYGGQNGVYRLDDKSAAGSRRGSSYLRANFGSEQIRTFYHWDGYQLAQADYSAFDRNRLLWRAEAKADALGFRDDAAILHSYRYLFGFDAKRGQLRWAYAHPRVDLVGAEDVGPAIVFVSADGEVGAVDAHSGAAKVAARTGLRVAGVTFDADGLAAVTGAQPPSLSSTLRAIVWDPDARFTAVKVFAVTALGAIPGAEASQALLEIVRAHGSSVPRAAQKRAGEVLVARKDHSSVPLYLEALQLRFDFLEGKHPEGVEVLARALAALKVAKAAPDVAVHLLDHETPQASLKDLAVALGVLGGKEAVQALRLFLLTYRCDPLMLNDPSSLTAAAEALLRIGGSEDRRTLTFVAEEARTIAPLREHLKKALTETAPR